MQTSDFIRQQYHRINDGEQGKGKCASVFADGEAIYSYGYHYPLLFVIYTPSGRRVWVRNTAGYSNTTAKHISWAGTLADIDAEMQRGEYYGAGISGRVTIHANVVTALQRELERLHEEMDAKKRKDTYIYSTLADRERAIYAALALLEVKDINHE